MKKRIDRLYSLLERFEREEDRYGGDAPLGHLHA